MNDEIRILSGKPGGGFGWPERVLGALFGVLLLVAMVAFGVLILGLVAAAALVLAVRLWWLRRGLRQGQGQASTVLEGEYQVLESRRWVNRQD